MKVRHKMKKKEIIAAIERGRDRIKKIEENSVAKEFRKDSAWLCAINDIIDRTALSIRDEIIKDEHESEEQNENNRRN
jgi:hypothetical protein